MLTKFSAALLALMLIIPFGALTANDEISSTATDKSSLRVFEVKILDPQGEVKASADLKFDENSSAITQVIREFPYNRSCTSEDGRDPVCSYAITWEGIKVKLSFSNKDFLSVDVKQRSNLAFEVFTSDNIEVELPRVKVRDYSYTIKLEGLDSHESQTGDGGSIVISRKNAQ